MPTYEAPIPSVRHLGALEPVAWALEPAVWVLEPAVWAFLLQHWAGVLSQIEAKVP